VKVHPVESGVQLLDGGGLAKQRHGMPAPAHQVCLVEDHPGHVRVSVLAVVRQGRRRTVESAAARVRGAGEGVQLGLRCVKPGEQPGRRMAGGHPDRLIEQLCAQVGRAQVGEYVRLLAHRVGHQCRAGGLGGRCSCLLVEIPRPVHGPHIERLPTCEGRGLGEHARHRPAGIRQHGMRERLLQRQQVPTYLVHKGPGAELAIHGAEQVGLSRQRGHGSTVDGSRSSDAVEELRVSGRGDRNLGLIGAEQLLVRHAEDRAEDLSVHGGNRPAPVLPLRDVDLQALWGHVQPARCLEPRHDLVDESCLRPAVCQTYVPKPHVQRRSLAATEMAFLSSMPQFRGTGDNCVLTAPC
jgi:hypothetical protein